MVCRNIFFLHRGSAGRRKTAIAAASATRTTYLRSHTIFLFSLFLDVLERTLLPVDHAWLADVA